MKKLISLCILLIILSLMLITQDSASVEQMLNKIPELFQRNIDSSFQVVRSAKKIAYKLGDTSLIEKSNFYISNLFKVIGKPDSSLYYDRIALKLALAQNDSLKIGQNYGSLAIDFGMVGKIDSSIKYQLLEYEILKIHGSPKDLVVTLTNLSMNYKNIYDFKKSYIYAKKAESVSKRTQDSSFYMLALSHLTTSLIKLDSNKSAKELYQVFVNSTYKDSIRKDYYINNLTNYASLLVDEGNLSQAKIYLDEASIMIKDYYTPLGDFLLNNTYSNYYLATRDFEIATKYAKEAYLIGHQLKDPASLLKSSYQLFKSYKELNRSDSALKYHIEYKSYSDSLLDKTKVRAIKELEAKYGLKLKNREIQDLRNKEALNEKIIKWQRITTSLFAMIIGLGAWFYLQNRKNSKEIIEKNKKIYEQHREIEKSKFEAELNQKEKEIFYAAKQIEQVNITMENLREEMESLERIKKDPPSLDRLINEISQSEGNEKRLKDFEYKFREMYPDFFDKLTNDYPDLSRTELRICAFLRMNLSTKEISSIVFTSIGTVNKHRYNIRKKMTLETEDNLNEILQKY